MIITSAGPTQLSSVPTGGLRGTPFRALCLLLSVWAELEAGEERRPWEWVHMIIWWRELFSYNYLFIFQSFKFAQSELDRDRYSEYNANSNKDNTNIVFTLVSAWIVSEEPCWKGRGDGLPSCFRGKIAEMFLQKWKNYIGLTLAFSSTETSSCIIYN